MRMSSKNIIIAVAWFGAAVLIACGGGGDSGSRNVANPPAASTKNFVYAVSSQANYLSGWEVASATGNLTAVTGSPFPGLDAPMTVAIDPLSKHVVVGNLNLGKLNVFAVNASSGSLSQVSGSPFQLVGGGYQLSTVFDPHGDYLYVSNSVFANSIGVYPVDVASGAVDSPEVFDVPNPIYTLAVDPSGGYLYALGTGISAFQINVGALLELPGSPFVSSLSFANAHAVVHPSGKFLMVADRDGGQLRVLALSSDGSIGADVAGSPFSLGAQPTAIATNSSGTVALVALDSNALLAVPVNPAGTLGSPSAAVATGDNPFSITVDVTDKYVYVANHDSASVSGFSLEPGPVLTPLPASPYPAGADLIGVVSTRFTSR